MKVIKYYIIRIADKHITYMKNSEGIIFERDTEEEIRADLDEYEKTKPFWFLGWKKEEVEIEE